MKVEYWHKDFQWNGISFSSTSEIINFADQNFPELHTFIREWFGEKGRITMMTSGSTGTPKTIGLHREHMVNSSKATASYFSLSNGSRVLLCLPLGYIAGRMMLVRSMVMGWQLDVINPSASPDIPQNVLYDFSAMVPLQLANSIDQLEYVQTLIVGGGQISDDLFEKTEHLKTKVYATYGMTETITHVALSPVNRAAGKKDGKPIFKALAGIHFSTDQRGCLIISAPGISSSAVVTNDIVKLLSDRSFIWLGRYDHVINSGGLKLLPELIEAKYKNLIGTDYFVYGWPDEVLGQKLVLFVEGEERSNLYKEIIDFQKQHLDDISKYEIPKEVMFVKNFIRTETGKVNRKKTVARLFTSGKDLNSLHG